MQVDAVLRSFFLHCQDTSETVYVNVLYKATSLRHASQYEQLTRDYPNVNFVRETNFRTDLIGMLNPYAANSNAYRLVSILGTPAFFRTGRRRRQFVDMLRYKFIYALLPRVISPQGILFLVDDNLFVRDFAIQTALCTLEEHTDVLGFSLRLGRNTTYSYTVDKRQRLPFFSVPARNLLKFQWPETSYDFGYPLEVSSSVYLNTVIVPFLASLHFRNPNELESAMAINAGIFRKSHPSLVCFEQSVTFCNPVNLVQSFHPNRVAEQYKYSVNDLLERFECGERIDIQAYSGFVPNACHQEVPLHISKSNNKIIQLPS